jgi:predicted MPP superfamily phosphohydrolase
MKRKTLVIIFSIIATILLADCLVYRYILRIIPSLNNPAFIHIIKFSYWAILPLFIVSFLFIWKKYYSSQKPAFSGITFKIVGLFILIYIPKILFGLTLIFQQIIIWGYRLLLLVINTLSHNRDLFLKENAFDFISLTGICLSGIAFMVILYGITLGRFRFRFRRVSLSFETLPETFNGFKVIQVSDLHAGSVYGNKNRYKKVVRHINDENPDLIFFTGDIVNEFSGELDGWENIIGQLKAGYGKFSVLGNHDYGDYYPWKSPEDKETNTFRIIDFETRMGFRVLMNESSAISLNGHEIKILGVENWGLSMFKQYGKLEKAIEGIEPSAFKILLSHDPSHWDAEVAGKTNINLTLSGHTHGFQFGIRTKRFKWSPVKRFYPRWEGLHRIGNQYMYVNTGLGYIGFPGRIGISPEITVLSLFTKKSNP